MSFSEAMEELEIPEDASPETKMQAVLQWELGYPEWHEQILDWLDEAGYEVKEKDKEQ